GRDQAMLLLAAVSEVLSGLDAWLAHSTGGIMRGAEWVPAIFGPFAGFGLLVAGVIALRRRTLASLFATGVFAASVVVGIVGAWLHLQRTVLPTAPPGQRVALDLFFWAPPILGPLAFASSASSAPAPRGWKRRPAAVGCDYRATCPSGCPTRRP